MRDTRDNVRMAGLVVLLLGVSLAAGAAALVQAGVPLEDASWAGMKLVHLILGTMGAGASLFFLPQFSSIELGRTVLCGVLASVVGTPFLAALATAASSKYLGAAIPGTDNVLAVALGVGGVYLIPGAQTLWKSVRDNPFGFIDRLRGRGPGGDGGTRP